MEIRRGHRTGATEGSLSLEWIEMWNYKTFQVVRQGRSCIGFANTELEWYQTILQPNLLTSNSVMSPKRRLDPRARINDDSILDSGTVDLKTGLPSTCAQPESRLPAKALAISFASSSQALLQHHHKSFTSGVVIRLHYITSSRAKLRCS